MGFVETVIRCEPMDVHTRLAELGTSLEALMRVRNVALNEAGNATPFHCANAPGTFAYHHGVFALRNEHVGIEWRVDRTEGIEGIYNENLKVRIAFSNVDAACGEKGPKPRTEKGSGAQRLCHPSLFADLPQYAPKPKEGASTFYLMIAENGAAELTRPVIEDKTFKNYIERIYLSFGGDHEIDAPLSFDADDAVVDFDPQVARR